jgi:mevalonate kinase
MTENHSLLQSLGLSCKELDHLVITANNSGATGAKLCGGGKGGNIVALADGAKAKSIKEALLANGAVNCLITVIESCQKDK